MAEQKASPAIAQTCMSFPVRTIATTASIEDAAKAIVRWGHTGLCVVDEQSALVGIVTRRDVDVAIRYGLGQVMVSACMGAPARTITPDTPLHRIQWLMATYDIGRLPVVAANSLVGIVTRSDVLRQLQSLQSVPDFSSLTSDFLPLALPAPDALYANLQQRMSAICPEVWPALTLMATVAESEGWSLYLVGGGVRDLLLDLLYARRLSDGAVRSDVDAPYPLTDIDLVVAGAQPGAGVRLANAIQARHTEVKLQVYGQFQTAALSWPQSANSPAFAVDIATARTEFYPYPAANPEVTSSTIHQDLYRRDFTMNAMALRLNGGPDGGKPGRLLDFFGGWIDLQQRAVRVIHPNSFIEDPTRIFRAVRFAVRLGFTLLPRTQQLVREAIASDRYSQLQASGKKIPALQSRLTAELRYLLSLDSWEVALAQVASLGALACLHPALSLSANHWQQLRRMARWQLKFLPQVPRWQLLLLLVIATLTPAQRDRVATRLILDSQSQHRLKTLHLWEAELTAQLPQCQRPSQVYHQLRSYGSVELLLIAARHPYTLGPQIWQYVVQLSRMPPLLNGATLKRLGYRPGPQFRKILTDVHQLTLDGELQSVGSAEDYVLAKYAADANDAVSAEK